MRVLPNGSGSEVVLTIVRQEGVSDEKFSEDARWVEKDPNRLKAPRSAEVTMGDPVTAGSRRPGALEALLSPWQEPAYALLRVVAGLMFSIHGAQKLFGVLGGTLQPTGSQLWIGGVLELACGVAVALGAFTSWAAFLASGEMAVAYVQFHWKLQLGAAFFPQVNKGELALLYAFAFLFIACRGAGRPSVDALRARGGARASGEA